MDSITQNEPRLAADTDGLSDEVRAILAEADSATPLRPCETAPGALNPGEYTWPAPPSGQPDVLIRMPYAAAWDIVIDGLVNSASMEAIAPENFGNLALDLLGLLTDASDDLASETETEI